MIEDTTATLLRTLADRYETVSFLDGDPSWWMHQVDGTANRESMAFLASVLSYGSRQQFMPKIGLLREMANAETDAWLRKQLYRQHFSTTDTSSFYRLYSHATMRTFLDAYSQMLVQHGSMKAYVASCCPDRDALGAVSAICRWFSAHGATNVVPRDTTSACKRICMFLRWMVRTDSPVDLGLWADIIDRSTLVIPLDTHVVQEAHRLGLPLGATASMANARRLTEAMQSVFPGDPTRADFALFGLGVDPSA